MEPTQEAIGQACTLASNFIRYSTDFSNTYSGQRRHHQSADHLERRFKSMSPTNTESKRSRSNIGPIAAGIALAFRGLRRLSPMTWLTPCVKLLGPAPTEDIAGDRAKDLSKRAAAVDYYVLGWLALEAAAVAVVTLGSPLSVGAKWTVIVLAGLRIIEIIQVAFNVSVFDRLDQNDSGAISTTRLAVLAAINFVELCVCFGLVYAVDFTDLKGAGQPVTAFYFSVITQLTIGYGDVYPTHFLRVVAAIQGLTGMVFVALVFTRVVGTLPQIKSILENRD